MGAGAPVVARFYEKMGIEIVQGPAKAAEMEAAVKGLQFGTVAISADSGVTAISKAEIETPWGWMIHCTHPSLPPPR